MKQIQINFITIFSVILFNTSCSKDDDNPSTTNSTPVITNQTFAIPNDARKDITAGLVLASDPDGDALTYSIVAGNTAGFFSISNTGLISLTTNLNAGNPEVNSLTVEVSDGKNKASASVIINLMNVTVSSPQLPLSAIFDGSLIAADYWSDQPEILSASLGFSDIVGVSGNALTQDLVEQAGGAWLTDISCDPTSTGLFTSTSLESTVANAYITKRPYQQFLKDGAIGMDGLPIVFSWPVISNTVDLNDVKITLNTGEVTQPFAISMQPNWENNERNCIVVFGEFGNRLPSTDPNTRYPVKVEIVSGNTPLMLLGPNNQQVSAVGLSWTNSSSPYDTNNGPRLVGAKLNHVGTTALGEGTNNPLFNQVLPRNDEFSLYGGGDFRLRILTTGGFSPDGVRGVLPTDYERFFRIHAKSTDNSTVLIEQVGVDYQVKGGKLRIVGLSDVGNAAGVGGTMYGDCYSEDRDNYIDIILVGDEEAAKNITFLEIPSLEGGYNAFYNPGGPGTTPFTGVSYSQPGPKDLEPVIMALDNPMRVTN